MDRSNVNISIFLVILVTFESAHKCTGVVTSSVFRIKRQFSYPAERSIGMQSQAFNNPYSAGALNFGGGQYSPPSVYNNVYPGANPLQPLPFRDMVQPMLKANGYNPNGYQQPVPNDMNTGSYPTMPLQTQQAPGVAYNQNYQPMVFQGQINPAGSLVSPYQLPVNQDFQNQAYFNPQQVPQVPMQPTFVGPSVVQTPVSGIDQGTRMPVNPAATVQTLVPISTSTTQTIPTTPAPVVPSMSSNVIQDSFTTAPVTSSPTSSTAVLTSTKGPQELSSTAVMTTQIPEELERSTTAGPTTPATSFSTTFLQNVTRDTNQTTSRTIPPSFFPGFQTSTETPTPLTGTFPTKTTRPVTFRT